MRLRSSDVHKVGAEFPATVNRVAISKGGFTFLLMKEAVVRAVANLLCTIIIAVSIFIGFGMLWEQDQLDYEQREKHHEEQKTLMSALIAVISDQSSESHSGFQESVSSPEIITTPGTIQNAPKIPATFLSERTAKKPATKPSASQKQ